MKDTHFDAKQFDKCIHVGYMDTLRGNETLDEVSKV